MPEEKFLCKSEQGPTGCDRKQLLELGEGSVASHVPGYMSSLLGNTYIIVIIRCLKSIMYKNAVKMNLGAT